MLIVWKASENKERLKIQLKSDNNKDGTSIALQLCLYVTYYHIIMAGV